MVKRFCRNCDVCGRSYLWKKRRKRFLKLLPVSDRFYSELSIDFITDLPAKKEGDPWFLMVITNRLLKSCTLKTITSIKAENCAEVFVQCYYRFHGFPKFITSDRGSNWVRDFWTRLCELVKIKQRFSIAFHSETDKAIKRINQEVQAYFRAFIIYA
jgi:hypothetical protein